MIIIFGINSLGVFKGGIQYTKMKINRNFNVFIDLKPLKLKVLIICLVIRYVSGYKDRRYTYLLWFTFLYLLELSFYNYFTDILINNLVFNKVLYNFTP